VVGFHCVKRDESCAANRTSTSVVLNYLLALAFRSLKEFLPMRPPIFPIKEQAAVTRDKRARIEESSVLSSGQIAFVTSGQRLFAACACFAHNSALNFFFFAYLSVMTAEPIGVGLEGV
jgi:hypothetical protein